MVEARRALARRRCCPWLRIPRLGLLGCFLGPSACRCSFRAEHGRRLVAQIAPPFPEGRRFPLTTNLKAGFVSGRKYRRDTSQQLSGVRRACLTGNTVNLGSVGKRLDHTLHRVCISNGMEIINMRVGICLGRMLHANDHDAAATGRTSWRSTIK